MILNFVWSVLLALGMIAFFTLAERKVIASVQRRKGPNVVGIWGSLQAIADGVKVAFKEIVMPVKANRDLFLIAPAILLALSLLHWAIIPLGYYDVVIDSPLGVLFVLAISSLGVYGIILSGWISNSKYAFIGALRSAAQMISYEISLSLVILPIILVVNSFNLTEIVFFQDQAGWLILPLLPLFLAFFVSMLAETNRTPFDLPEAEIEIVIGYNVEYSAMTFALFFLGEYGNMLVLAFIITLFFLGGWVGPFAIMLPLGFWYIAKVLMFCFLYIFVRANLPRYRYDQLMSIGWKVLLPLTLGYLVLVAGLLAGTTLPTAVTDWVIAYGDTTGTTTLTYKMNMTTTFLFPLIFTTMLVGGFIGLLTGRDNVLRLVISLELMLLGVNSGLIFASLMYSSLLSQFFVILILSVAAAEAAIGLGLLVVAYKRTGSIKFNTFSVLRG